MAPFYGWFSTTSRLEPHRGGSLLFTTKFPEIPGAHCINLERMKGWVNSVAWKFAVFHLYTVWKSSQAKAKARLILATKKRRVIKQSKWNSALL